MRESEPLLAFLHVPKCGGTTLLHVMQHNYGRDALMLWRPRRSFAENREELDGRAGRARALVGHVGFGLHEQLGDLGRALRMLTMLRHPLALVVSRHGYRAARAARAEGADPLAAAASAASLDEFAQRVEDNPMVRFLSGLALEEQLGLAPGGRASFEDVQLAHARSEGAWPVCGPEQLERARANLRDRIDAFGLVERFDESLVLFARAFGWRTLYYRAENVGRAAPAPPSPEVERMILERNALDLALYREAEALFEERVRRGGAALARELAHLQRWNGLAAPLVRWRFEGPRRLLRIARRRRA